MWPSLYEEMYYYRFQCLNISIQYISIEMHSCVILNIVINLSQESVQCTRSFIYIHTFVWGNHCVRIIVWVSLCENHCVSMRICHLAFCCVVKSFFFKVNLLICNLGEKSPKCLSFQLRSSWFKDGYIWTLGTWCRASLSFHRYGHVMHMDTSDIL